MVDPLRRAVAREVGLEQVCERVRSVRPDTVEGSELANDPEPRRQPTKNHYHVEDAGDVRA